MSRRRRLFWTLLAAAVAFVPGCIAGVVASNALPPKIESVPLPHHIPKSPKAVSFRFAMAHDVIHERYPRHGLAFYHERERRAREKLATIPADSDEAFAFYDDIAAGHERRSDSYEAVAILRKKLDLQQKRGVSGRDLYTTYANLGTFLMQANMRKAIGGNAEAKAAFCKGVEFIRKSVQVNPEAHFGRENWQIVLGEFFLKAMDNPNVLTKFDFVGNRVDLNWDKVRDKVYERTYLPADEFGRAATMSREWESEGVSARSLMYEWNRIDRNSDRIPEAWEQLKRARNNVTKVGAEESWFDIFAPSHFKPVPFDEPMLGMIGMWRQGVGATPHFALCIGEIMLRVGQRRIAWTAYERAKQLSDKFWPKADIQKALREHCDRRQKEIEDTLPKAEVATLRPTFDDELAYGLNYQKEYRDYESAKIAAGVDIADEHFFDEFHQDRAPIASPTGSEEWYVFRMDELDRRIFVGLGGGPFLSGLVAFLTSVWLYRRAKKMTSVVA